MTHNQVASTILENIAGKSTDYTKALAEACDCQDMRAVRVFGLYGESINGRGSRTGVNTCAKAGANAYRTKTHALA